MASPSFRLQEATIDDIHAAFRSGQLTCRQLVELYLKRIEALDQQGPQINSVITVNPRALDEADAVDRAFRERGEFIGPLHGLPILVKDQAETRGLTTTFGSVALKDYVPDSDATVVERIRAAGAVVLAKTNMPDFATSWFGFSSSGGETKNPYVLERDAGGSSAGTGAGVAANFGAIGIGEDTGGSIRLPASFDNVVGLRVTTGLISRTGCSPLVEFQDTAGPMARTVRDTAIFLDSLIGYDPKDPYTVAALMARRPEGGYASVLSPDGLRGVRLGVLRDAFGADDDPESGPVNRVIEQAIADLRRLGAEVIDPVRMPDLQEYLVETSLYLHRSKYDLDRFLAARPSAPMRSVREIYEAGQYHPRQDLFIQIAEEAPEVPEDVPDYFRKLAKRDVFRREVLKLMAEHQLDALVFPDVQVLPPVRADLQAGRWTVLGFPTNTLIGSQTDLPGISVPAGFSPDGVPVGLEFLGKLYDEANLLRYAYAYEQGTGHRRAPESAPPLPGEP